LILSQNGTKVLFCDKKTLIKPGSPENRRTL